MIRRAFNCTAWETEAGAKLCAWDCTPFGGWPGFDADQKEDILLCLPFIGYSLLISNSFSIGCKNDCTHSSSSMTHHIKESKSAKGYIKEVCFSSDGRLICSPFKNGVRLLSFDPNCNELCYCAPEMSAVPLSVVNTIISHKRSVLTSAFSPILPLLVTGCRGGDVHFHFPRF